MNKLINILLKIIASLFWWVALLMTSFISLIFWNFEYVDKVNHLLFDIWEKEL